MYSRTLLFNYFNIWLTMKGFAPLLPRNVSSRLSSIYRIGFIGIRPGDLDRFSLFENFQINLVHWSQTLNNIKRNQLHVMTTNERNFNYQNQNQGVGRGSSLDMSNDVPAGIPCISKAAQHKGWRITNGQKLKSICRIWAPKDRLCVQWLKSIPSFQRIILIWASLLFRWLSHLFWSQLHNKHGPDNRRI